jgi:hypothetical protein
VCLCLRQRNNQLAENQTVITENKLQAQIIQLQQTVINVLQDALADNRNLSQADLNRLIAAQETARVGSINALNAQYDRMVREQRSRRKSLAEGTLRQRRILPSEEPVLSARRQLTLPPARSESVEPLRRARTLPVAMPNGLCLYSEELQRTEQPLSSSFSSRGSHRCPVCDLYIDTAAPDNWIIEVRKPVLTYDNHLEEERHAVETRSFEVGARFVVKCHTEGGEFACVLCPRYRDVDAFCGNVESLITHLGQKHTSDQFEEEIDLLSV